MNKNSRTSSVSEGSPSFGFLEINAEAALVVEIHIDTRGIVADVIFFARFEGEYKFDIDLVARAHSLAGDASVGCVERRLCHYLILGIADELRAAEK